MAKSKKGRNSSAIKVQFKEHDLVAVKSFGRTFHVDGQVVDCYLRQPGNDPAFRIDGKWYVVPLNGVAEALIEQVVNKGGK